MNKRPLIFLDSGVGGLAYYRRFAGRNQNQQILYIADREHFPYGKKTKAELVALLTGLTARLIKKCNPSIIVLACNTASVSALAELRLLFPQTTFVGTIPAVKPAVQNSVLKKIGVLGTERTVQDNYIDQIVHSIDARCAVIKIAAAELVDFVEHTLYSATKEQRFCIAKKYVLQFREAGVDSIVLGCTHFLFLFEEFQQAAAPDISIYDSIEGVCHQIERLLLQETKAECAEQILLVSGGAALEENWQRWADDFNLRLLRFEDYLR